MSLTALLVGACGCQRVVTLRARMRVVERVCICDPSMGRAFRFAGEFDRSMPVYREIRR